jgi:hypothetical protein
MDIIFPQSSHTDKKPYKCEICNIETNNKKDYNNHLLTNKHIKKSQGYVKPPINLICKCGKKYNYYSGLHKHAKKCTYSLEVLSPDVSPQESLPQETLPQEVLPTNISFLTKLVLEVVKTNTELQKTNNDDNKDFKNLILELMKSNTDLQKQMLDMCKNSNTTINNNTKTKNSHNKTFNMQIFLNEHCKDAMNIKDFADSFKLEISDFEKVGHLGYVDGISDIIIKKLNEMDIHKRPIHCSDTKRDTMYVHADDVWIKDNSDHDEVRALVQRITAKNIRMIPIWQDMYPNSRNNMHKLNDTYMSLTRQAMGGFGGTIPENESKIIRKIAKSVFIDKNM